MAPEHNLPVVLNERGALSIHIPEMKPHGYGSKWVPMDPDSFDRLLPKTTSFHLPEQPAHYTAKTEYRRLFALVNRIEARRRALENAAGIAMRALSSTNGKQTRMARRIRRDTIRALIERLEAEENEQARIEREGLLPPFKSPVDVREWA